MGKTGKWQGHAGKIGHHGLGRMGKLADLMASMRPMQWYKNAIVFAAPFFAGRIFDATLWLPLVCAFASLCAISSSGYVINDIIDAKSDRSHGGKISRPVASGKIGKAEAVVLAAVLAGIGFAIPMIFLLGSEFLFLAALLFTLMMAYNFIFKEIAFLDVNALSANFIVRAYAGGAIAGVAISPWFLMGSYVAALFLAVGKRRSDLESLGSEAWKYKKVLGAYSLPVLDAMLVVCASALICIYAIYTFQSQIAAKKIIFATIPLVFFGAFRYIHIAMSDGRRAGEPQNALLDIPLAVSGSLVCIIFLAALYL